MLAASHRSVVPNTWSHPAGANRRDKCRSALLADSKIFRGRFAPVLHLLIAHLGTLIEVAQAGLFHGRDVYKHVFAAVIGLNKSKSLSRVEPLHNTSRHCPHSLLNQWQQLRSSRHFPARKTRRVASISPTETRLQQLA